MPIYCFQGLAHSPGYCLIKASSPEEAREKGERGDFLSITVEDDASDFTINDDDGPEEVEEE